MVRPPVPVAPEAESVNPNASFLPAAHTHEGIERLFDIKYSAVKHRPGAARALASPREVYPIEIETEARPSVEPSPPNADAFHDAFALAKVRSEIYPTE